MAYFHTTVLDNQIKALPTVDTASGSIATFDTDMTENLVEVECEIIYQQASGTPSPSNPLPITTYTSLNLSHSGADTSNPTITNIPFGQTVAKGTLNVTTGVLTITHLYQLFTGDNSEAWTSSPSGGHYRYLIARGDLVVGQIAKSNLFECVETSGQADNYKFYIGNSYVTFYYDDITTLTAWRTFLSNNNLQLVGELTTPLTVQLDSTQIIALLNENNIWCDTNGDTSVKYILSVGKAIS